MICDAAEDNADRLAVAEFRRRLAAGDEEPIPARSSTVSSRARAGLRVWREHRGLNAASLAARSDLSQAVLSQIETGKRDGTVDTYRTIAAALDVSLDDLLGP